MARGPTPVIATRTGIPLGELVADELVRLQELESDLHRRVVGQDEAVERVSDTIRRARVGLSERDRPLGFLMAGAAEEAVDYERR